MYSNAAANKSTPSFNFDWKTDTLPGSGAVFYICIVKNTSLGTIGSLCIYNNSGTYYLRLIRSLPSSQTTDYEYAFATNTTYNFTFDFIKDASDGGLEVYLSDALVIDDTGLDTSGIAFYRIEVGRYSNNAGSSVVLVDNALIHDTHISLGGGGVTIPIMMHHYTKNIGP